MATPGRYPGAPNTGKLTPQEIAAVAQGAGFQGEDLVIAVAVAMTESGGDVWAYNNSGLDESYGLWQINMKGALEQERLKLFGIDRKERLLVPVENNAKAAKILRDTSRGWAHWSVYSNRSYTRFLEQARVAAGSPQKPGIDPGIAPDSNVLDVLAIFQPIFDWMQKIGLRIAGFVGGGVLLILAIVLYIRSQK